ncbi:MAG: hypothetical protein AB8G05_18185 [Oligoflexales bacterium]
MLKNLAISLLLSKTMAFSPSQFHAHKLFRHHVCRQFAVNPSQVHDRYIELLGKSPYQEKIDRFFKNEILAINDSSIMHMYIDTPEDEWLPQFESEKNKILENVSGDIFEIAYFGDLLKDSVNHSLEVLSSQIDPEQHLPIRISIRVDAPREQVLDKPQWHPDSVSFHLLMNLLSEHCTQYHGPANGGPSFSKFYELSNSKLNNEAIIEVPLGRYIFSSQGDRPVYHASPIKKHRGRVVIVLQVGPSPSIEEVSDEIARGVRPS